MIRHSIVIDRPAEEVFAYLDQLDRHSEWQSSLESARVETDGPTRVGTRVIERRRVPGGTQEVPYEITEHDPPRRASFRGTSGPIRPVGTTTVEPVSATSARVSIELDLEGHGLGKALAVVARRQAAVELPKSHQKLKELLEGGVATGQGGEPGLAG